MKKESYYNVYNINRGKGFFFLKKNKNIDMLID